MKNVNLILSTDSYKLSHYLQYPAGTEYISSYVEARGSDDPDYMASLFVGLQMLIKEYLLTPVTHEDVDEAVDVAVLHGVPFNEAGWRIIVNEFGGYLPLQIEAVPEGIILPLRNALIQVTNTDPRFPWLVSYFETILLRAGWYSTTVATNSWTIKQSLLKYADVSGCAREAVDFKLHDFGARGVSSQESAMIGGAGHLVPFRGTDTLEAIVAARRYYNEKMAGGSIPAAEHSTITSWLRSGESLAYKNMVKQFGGEGKIFAVVSDSYDIFNAVQNIWGGELKKHVTDNGGTLVVRPDSGDPTRVPLDVIDMLMEKFGHSTNQKNYKVLPDCVRVIQGDGINKDSIKTILDTMDRRKQSLDNIAFGMGGALLQGVNRDTLKFAMKASAICVNDTWNDVYKDPVTDTGKRSKRGIQSVIKTDEGYQTVRRDEAGKAENLLTPVFRNGELLVDHTFADIRARADAGIQ